MGITTVVRRAGTVLRTSNETRGCAKECLALQGASLLASLGSLASLRDDLERDLASGVSVRKLRATRDEIARLTTHVHLCMDLLIADCTSSQL